MSSEFAQAITSILFPDEIQSRLHTWCFDCFSQRNVNQRRSVFLRINERESFGREEAHCWHEVPASMITFISERAARYACFSITLLSRSLRVAGNFIFFFPERSACRHVDVFLFTLSANRHSLRVSRISQVSHSLDRFSQLFSVADYATVQRKREKSWIIRS